METLQSAGRGGQVTGKKRSRGLDRRVVSAAREALESGSLIPLIKEELWCKIQARRLSEGQGELKVVPSPVAPCKLSPDDLEKRKLRREQNKCAARRFRAKVKEKGHILMERISLLHKENDTLEKLRETLSQEKIRLAERLDVHLAMCTTFDDELLTPISEVTEPRDKKHAT